MIVATVDASNYPVALIRPYTWYLLCLHRIVEIKGVLCHQLFSALSFIMGFSRGGFINAWVNEVFWVFFFGDITEELFLQSFLKGVACHGF